MKRIIYTSLIGKEEEFKILELGRALSLPVLLIGKPGVSKTAVVLDYFKSIHPHARPEDCFVLETDESTPNSAIKGLVNIEKLYKSNTFETIAPITTANCILINEIDKSSAMVRNSLLGIMNERMIFSGKEKVACDWQLFVATCNQIPRNERQSPFFDRFIIKHEVYGINRTQMMEYFSQGGRCYEERIEINLADSASLATIVVPTEKIKVFVDLFIERVSNRSLTYLPEMVKAIVCIWECSINQALIKCAQIMMTNEAAVELSRALYTDEEIEIMGKLDLLQTQKSSTQYKRDKKELEQLIDAYKLKSNSNKEEFLKELEYMLHKIYADTNISKTIPVASLN